MRFYPFDSTGKERDTKTGCGYIGPLGGRYQNYYKYDPLHRLTRAGGSNQYGFEQAFELSRAGRPLSMSTNGMVKHYAYGEHTPPHAPQRIMVEDGYRRTLHDLRWDPAGNLGQVSTLAHDRGDIRSRFLFWTEDSRLHTVVDDRHHSYYAYDHAGERTLKVTGHSHQLDVNADLMHTAAGLDEFTLYPSPYLVFTNRGYTKHYYAGSERLAARLGGGFDRPVVGGDHGLSQLATALFEQCQKETEKRVLEAIPPHTIRRDHLSENIYMAMMREFEIPMHLMANAVIKSNNLLSTAQNIVSGNAEPEVYFYHSDHLGSASWITDKDGNPVQHLQYLPYGEPYINQRVSGYNERFTFTGKDSRKGWRIPLNKIKYNEQRDEETGFGYFGARYMDHELMTMWLSVDPLSDKYPSISPYAYCAWNPIKLIDPDGRDIWELNKSGELIWKESSDEDIIRAMNGKEVKVRNGVLVRGDSYTKNNNGHFSMNFGDDVANATEVFEFLADNASDIEFCLTGSASSKDEKDVANYAVSSSFDKTGDKYTSKFARRQAEKGVLRLFYHNHPKKTLGPSNATNPGGDGLDDVFVEGVRAMEKNRNVEYSCEFKIYCSITQGKTTGVYRLFGAGMDTGKINKSRVNKRGTRYKYE